MDLPPAIERKVVRNADITLAVKDVLKAVDQVTQLAQRLGGWVVSSSVTGQQEEQPRATVTLRVPEKRFYEALSELRHLGDWVVSEAISSQDVTEEYIDLEARLRNLEETEKQLRRLLEKADTVKDVLEVYRELSNTRGEIERIRGRMQYLEGVSAESRIIVRLEPAVTTAPLVRPGWSPGETFKSAARGLASGGQAVVDFGIRLLVFTPFWLPPVGLLLGGAWWWRGRRGHRP